MKNRINHFFYLLYRGFCAMGTALARLCYRIKFEGIGISPIPGVFTCNISFRAGGSGPTHHPAINGVRSCCANSPTPSK